MDPAVVAQNFFKYKQRADLLIEVGRYREALKELAADLAAYPGGYSSLCQSAFCHLQLGEFQRAYDLTKEALAADPEGEWAHRLQSLVFTATGDNKRACEAAQRAVQAAPNFIPSLHTLAYSLVGVWRPDEAEEVAVKMLKIAPDSVDAYDAAGYIALKKEEYETAEKYYLAALKLDPESVPALNNLGVIYLHYSETGKGKEYRKRSAEMFERAVKTQPTFETGQENLAMALGPVAKAGAPIGLILAVCWGANALKNLTRGGIEFGPDILQSLTLLSPYSSSYVVLGLNIFSLVAGVAILVFAIRYFFSKDRVGMMAPFRRSGTWLVLGLATFFPLAFYIVFLILLGSDASAFSYLAMILLFIITMYAIMKSILYFQLRDIR